MNVVIATDGSANAHHALREAARLFPLQQATLYLVAVAPVDAAIANMAPGGGMDGVAGMELPIVLEQLERNAGQHLAIAIKIVAELGLHASPLEREGDPAHEILAVAREVQADLIVMGSHGYGAFKRLLLGSVSDAVARRAPGAVLIVKLEPAS